MHRLPTLIIHHSSQERHNAAGARGGARQQGQHAGSGALQGSKNVTANPSNSSTTNQPQQQRQRPSARSLETVEVQPLHVVLAGTAVMR